MKCILECRVGKTTIRLDTQSVNHEQWQRIQEELQTAKAGLLVHFSGKHFDDCAQAVQTAFFGMCRVIQEAGHRVRIKIDGEGTSGDLIGWVIGRLVGAANLRLHELRLTTAISCAAAYCTEVGYDAVAGRIVDRLKELHVPTRLSTVLSRIKSVKDVSDSGDRRTADPAVLAKEFFDSLSTDDRQNAAPTDDKLIHFYAEEFYLYDERTHVWSPMCKMEVLGLVAQFLQQRGDNVPITQRVVGDIVLNLRGLALLPSIQAMPFRVRKYGPPPLIERRKFVSFRNGLVDLAKLAVGKKPGLRPHTPHWFSTTQLPFDFDPTAACPKWLDFLARCLERDPKTGAALRNGDRRLEILQEAFGYCLLTDARFQKFFIFVGNGDNGKSVALSVLGSMLGGENVSHIGLEQLSNTFGLESLLGKSANICGDLNDVGNVAEGILKRLTGTDRMTVNRKYRPAAPMEPGIKLFFQL